jgi:hypothetical protein
MVLKPAFRMRLAAAREMLNQIEMVFFWKDPAHISRKLNRSQNARLVVTIVRRRSYLSADKFRKYSTAKTQRSWGLDGALVEMNLPLPRSL